MLRGRIPEVKVRLYFKTTKTRCLKNIWMCLCPDYNLCTISLSITVQLFFFIYQSIIKCNRVQNMSKQHRSMFFLLFSVAVVGLWTGFCWSSWWRHRGCGGPAPRSNLLPAEEHAGHRGAGSAQSTAAHNHLPQAGWRRSGQLQTLYSLQVKQPRKLPWKYFISWADGFGSLYGFSFFPSTGSIMTRP